MKEEADFLQMNSYALGYRAYIKASKVQKNQLECIKQHMPIALEKLHLDKERRSRLNILSIGPGDGFMDQEILKIVQEEYLKTKEVEMLNTAVEPNIEFFHHYKKSVEKQSAHEVIFDLKPLAFERYAESKHDPNQYDIVHAIHSLYYVDDMESTLKHCYYNELGEKGLIVCLIGNDTDLAAVTYLILEKCRPEYQRMTWNNPAAHFMHLVEKNSMKYDKMVIPFSVDVTNVFNESSEEGSHLLDFVTHEDNYRQTADPNEIKDVLKGIKDISTEDDNGRLIVNCNEELVLIYKTP